MHHCKVTQSSTTETISGGRDRQKTALLNFYYASQQNAKLSINLTRELCAKSRFIGDQAPCWIVFFATFNQEVDIRTIDFQRTRDRRGPIYCDPIGADVDNTRLTGRGNFKS
uniref:Uncharacterized protein n=1 Tax=Romanomermis culicivorax TaxID=13658 RepID=A0A915HVG7_ROMCU